MKDICLLYCNSTLKDAQRVHLEGEKITLKSEYKGEGGGKATVIREFTKMTVKSIEKDRKMG